ncbi:ExeM/NucH family extracellular endonuclease [Microbacterium dextranolyticum]|uniref:Multifunctional nuclease/2',3'-cyclic-nucleotide 2'-phosphodiesterase/5'-nucleotidase/3'-nucleotidase n=1 Tax=Microbacterium dextranolyticum TaxID=36806 RepID=A0A9W6HNH8_9MICO|nr:ExeM/NucH family extracellular endonuclease [Microbacterium dextranolyticum]MBM7462890.1 5'-nucleotidase [Microbacterium dextranolyticum]GLJ96004.1 multifunctional nuclease/2',3'-cyclic-nucleotide 2'-phosphodiesterase/5'-nucleotidase/3'-nucleotidase [Microbacterium dextranolyticum]
MSDPTPGAPRPTAGRRTPRALVAAITAGALAIGGAGVIALPAEAAVSTGAPVLINEVYGGGGNSGATYTNDFVELVNVSSAPVSLEGWSLQYAAAASGKTFAPQALSGTIPAGATFLVQEAKGDGGTTPLPTPDATGTLALSGKTGKVALASTTTAVTGPNDDAVVDYVAWGASAAPAAGSPAHETTNTTSITRDAAHTNTAVNSADFTVAEPTPQNSGSSTPSPEPSPSGSTGPSPSASATGSPTPTPTQTQTPSPQTITPIAQIQGTGDSTPLNGQTVTTEGVVTAHYATGGYNGYVIQTPGTGGTLDLSTHAASDAVFVYTKTAAVASEVALGDTVRVTGTAGEFNGLTQLSVNAGMATKIADAAKPAPVVLTTWLTSVAQRESLESMLVSVSGSFTVTNTNNTSRYGEVGLAAGNGVLRQPTDVGRPGSAEAAAVAADNLARGVVLDDGGSLDYAARANNGTGALLNGNATPAYVSLEHPVVVGGTATLSGSFVLDYRNNRWKLNPASFLPGDGTTQGQATFTNPRTSAPAAVGGDLSVGSFNVLNYFTTLGSSNTACQPYTDRAGNGTNVRTGCDLRGAWSSADLTRQQSKIVSAINTLDASVVGLMEIENSSKSTPSTPDKAVSTLVDALNSAAGTTKWAYVPASAQLPDASQQDVIRNAIIYQPALVQRVGDALALGTQSASGQAFGNAREPIAQRFAPTAGGAPFLFVVNHFKSKSSSGASGAQADQKDGQGAWNPARIAQAAALRDWVSSITTSDEATILVGDFNSYTHEDPLQVLYDAGYVDAESALKVGRSTYSFDGLSGSLDHVLYNAAAQKRVTGGDVWNINSGESVALEYSRYNNHGTLFWQDGPYRSSDHDPLKVGLSARTAVPTTIDILTINDFHGRIEAGSQGEAGAAVLAGAVKAKKAKNPNTLLVSAGDNIGASTFTSLIQQDSPTIDSLKAAGLEVSAVGNHEFDRGFADLTKRVIPRFGGNTDPASATPEQIAAGSPYALGANVYKKGTKTPALQEYTIKTIDGVRVAFIGTVTTDTARMVDPKGIEDIDFGDQLEAANRVAATIAKGHLADVTVLLTHSGSSVSNNCDAVATDPSDFGTLVRGASASIDAIVSAHTHQTYACKVQVASTGKLRPVIQASEYGKALGQLSITYDTQAHELVSIAGSTSPLAKAYPADADVAALVAGFAATANVIGAQPVGKITADILRGGTRGSDRGVESTMGNTVADIYLWATSTNPAYAGKKAQIALMNPGGLRADLIRTGDGTVTYKQIADVQPFANTLVTVTLTGAQLKDILTRQWQATGDRPKLHLGVSQGFTYEYTEDAPPAGQTASRSGRIVSMSLNGTKIADTDTFTVVTNSFLANGGDGFTPFAQGTDRTDTGQVDLDATLAYAKAITPIAPSALGRAKLVTGTTPDPSSSTSPTGAPTGAPTGVPSPNPSGTLPSTGGSTVGVSTSGLGSGNRIERGSSFTVTLTGLAAYEQVAATLNSDPIVITGIPAADANGTVTFTVNVPRTLATGTHHLIVLGADGRVLVNLPLQVVGEGTLATTGAELPWSLALGGAFLLAAGLVLAMTRRRTRIG